MDHTHHIEKCGPVCSVFLEEFLEVRQGMQYSIAFVLGLFALAIIE